jgi:putative colanic acid biosynthesis acetyltransferase WcaF
MGRRAQTGALPYDPRVPAADPQPVTDGVVSPPIDLSRAGNGDFETGRSKLYIGLWLLVEWIFVTNSLQISSALRIKALRAFGATIGEGVIMRQRIRIKFPWRLTIGDRCWIGEGVWIHNQGELTIGADTVISQESFLTTGSHDLRATMDLVIRPVRIGSGVWVTSRCMVLSGVEIGDNAVILPGSVVDRSVEPQSIYGGVPARFVKRREMDT